MPAIIKYTLIIDGPGHGFSESLFVPFDTENLISAADTLFAVTQKRAPLLGAQHNIKAQRVSVEVTTTGAARRGDSRLKKVFLPGTQARPSAEANVSLQCLFANFDSSKRKLMFQGGPWRDIFPFDDAFDIGVGNFQQFFNSWKTSLIALGAGWMGQVEIGNPVLITNYVADVNFNVTFTLAAPGISWATLKNQQVRIKGLNNGSVLNGQQLVRPIDALHCITVKPIAAGAFQVPGFMTAYTKAFIGLAPGTTGGLTGTIEPQNPMTRERGRPLLVSVGRRPARPRT